MTFHLKTKGLLSHLHGTVGLTDWDMDKELKLATTTDQFYHDTFVTPSLWLLVDPNIVCPIPSIENTPDQQEVSKPDEGIQTAQLNPAETQRPSTDYMNEDVCRRPAKTRRKGRTPNIRDSKTLKPGCWPRPPVNYCILIALALKSSHTGSLKVQQIYNFTREHFPFFQTAPDGWKNTIRHNLCFNSSFRKTCNQLCRDGKRKSCFWHLTLDGHRRLKDEIGTLTGESFKQLERSMSRPDEIQSLFAL
ncbi:forkhead box protein N5-like [Lycodopsis pacificus]